MKVLVPLDLTKNELRNAVIQNLASAPSTPGTGQLYTDTSSTPVLKFWDGAEWVAFGSGSGTVTGVTAGDGTITVGGTPGVAVTVAVATGGVTNAQVSGSAAIAYSKLNLTGAVLAADIAAAAGIPYSKLTLTNTVVNADISGSAAIAYSKLNLTGSVLAADIVAAAGIPYSKLTLTGGIVNADISPSASIVYSKINLGGSVTNTDIANAAAIAYSKLSLANSVVNADISGSAAIAYSKLNLSAGVVNSDVSASAAIAFSKLASPVAAFSFNSQVLQSLGTPTLSTDAATKGYVDSVSQGLTPKGAALAASTATVSLSSAPSTLDGVTLTAGCRVLLKDQSTASQNGIYVFASAGSALTRATDMDAWTEIPSAYLWVEEGTVNADTAWVCTSDPGGTLETTAVAFSKFSAATTMGATAPLSIVSNSVTLGYTARFVSNAGNLDLASSVVTPGTYQSLTVDTFGRVTAGGDLVSGNGIAARTAAGAYSARTITGTASQIAVTAGDGVSGNPTIALAAGARSSIAAAGVYNAAGSGTASTFTITQATHGLGTLANLYTDISAVCWDCSANPAVVCYPDIAVATDTGNVTFTFASSQTLSNYRFSILGK